MVIRYSYFHIVSCENCIVIAVKENLKEKNVTVNQFYWGLFKASQTTKLSDLRHVSQDRIKFIYWLKPMPDEGGEKPVCTEKTPDDEVAFNPCLTDFTPMPSYADIVIGLLACRPQ